MFRLTRQLRTVTAAAKAVGRGEPPVVLEETGALEVRDLSRGFNQMPTNLQKLDDERRIMLAGISHDIKTPLTHLRIAVELAATQADSEVATGMVRDIEDMDAILNQFLDYARDGSEEPATVGDLNALVEEVCERYRSRGIPLRLSLGPVAPFAFRKRAMFRVGSNLGNNAVRYGRIDSEVETEEDGAMAKITVADHGQGIRSGDPADFIKPFARENASRSESGAGLGLAIVERVVRTHGGRLHLATRETGGLLVVIELPRDLKVS
ncbi:MAG: HAMP domain-containing protein [Candidatus Synoicihabitans palmerolidicus]|nr:HAMP domain-containing protein [Candidatus Synoicihabitans palmerolidicus]